MTTVSQAIISAAEQIQTGNAADLKQGLQKIAGLSKQQLTANQTSISYPLQLLTEAVDRNLKVNQQQITPQLGIRKLLKQTTDVLPDKLKRQMMPTIKTIQRNTTQAERIGQQQKAKEANEQQQTRKEIQRQMNRTDKDLMKLQKPIRFSQQTAMSSVEQQIQPYRQILEANMPQVTQPNQLPSVMKLLTNYATVQGLKPVGSVSNKGGSAYVGIKQFEDQTLGIKTFSPYMIQKQPQKKSIPSISMQLQYYANKTMNSWNRYIQNQSQFVSFIGKVNTPTNRQIYMQKQFRTLNIMTFSAQSIATLSNYYIYMPLLKMASLLNSDQSLSPTYETFINRYQVGTSIDLNPLLLTRNNAVNIVSKMFSLKSLSPIDFLAQVMETVKDAETPLNKKAINKFQQYTFNKISEARQFLSNNGVQAQLAESVLASKDWSSVKKKKVLMGRGATNPYIAQLARKIVKSQGQQLLSIKTVDFSWSNEEILAYDYIWGWSNKYN